VIAPEPTPEGALRGPNLLGHLRERLGALTVPSKVPLSRHVSGDGGPVRLFHEVCNAPTLEGLQQPFTASEIESLSLVISGKATGHLELTPFLDDGSHVLGLDDAELRRLVEVVDDQARVEVA